LALDEMVSFHGSNGGERPAGTTLTLVLDVVGSSKFNPVDVIGEVFSVERSVNGVKLGFNLGDTTKSRFLLKRPV